MKPATKRPTGAEKSQANAAIRAMVIAANLPLTDFEAFQTAAVALVKDTPAWKTTGPKMAKHHILLIWENMVYKKKGGAA